MKWWERLIAAGFVFSLWVLILVINWSSKEVADGGGGVFLVFIVPLYTIISIGFLTSQIRDAWEHFWIDVERL